MTIYVTITRNSQVYQFANSKGVINFGTNADFPVYIIGTVNWGNAQYKQIFTRKPYQNGDTYVGFQLEPRVFQLPILTMASSPEEMMSRRYMLSKIFNYGDDEILVNVSWSDATGNYARKIRGHVVGGLDFDTDAEHNTLRTVVQIKANDPTWENGINEDFTISGVIAGTPTLYPKVYPVLYGDNLINKTTLISYDGSWDAYPTIRATGPISNLTMVDTQGHVIKFNGSIPTGAVWTIDLSYGVYTVIDQDGIDQFAALDVSSNLVDWRIYATPGGNILNNNSISISGTGASGASLVVLTYVTRYIGV